VIEIQVSKIKGGRYMSSNRFSVIAGSFVAAWLAVGAAFAQTPALDAGVGPHVELSAAQKMIIYQSISPTAKNNAAPTGFRATIGAILPPGVTAEPVPATIVQLMSQTKGLEVAMVEGQVLLIDPQGKQVVAVITQEAPK
jgi:hypothetical protein